MGDGRERAIRVAKAASSITLSAGLWRALGWQRVGGVSKGNEECTDGQGTAVQYERPLRLASPQSQFTLVSVYLENQQIASASFAFMFSGFRRRLFIPIE